MKYNKPTRNGHIQITWSWSNWTIGFWWMRSTLGALRWGIDLGPLEFLYRAVKVKR